MRARSASSRLASLLLAIALLTSSCSFAVRGHPGDVPILLHIENGQFDAVTVYLMRDGVPLRVGVVDGLGTRTLRLPRAYLGSGAELALRAESKISHHTHVSPFFHIDGAENIFWAVRGSGTLSTFAVR